MLVLFFPPHPDLPSLLQGTPHSLLHTPAAPSLVPVQKPLSRTRTHRLFCATLARLGREPSSIIAGPFWSGCAAYSSRRARIGSIHLIRLSAIAVLHSMQPIPAVRQPSAAHLSVSGGENNLCQSYTGQNRDSRGRCGAFAQDRSSSLSSSRESSLAFAQRDGVAITLRHLPAVCAGNAGRLR